MRGNVYVIALIATALWFGIGVWQRSRTGLALSEAAVQELPLTLLFFVAALAYLLWRRRKG